MLIYKRTALKGENYLSGMFIRSVQKYPNNQTQEFLSFAGTSNLLWDKETSRSVYYINIIQQILLE